MGTFVRTRGTRSLLVLALAGLSACGGTLEETGELGALVSRLLGGTLLSLAGQTLLWSWLGLLAGVAMSIALYRGVRSYGFFGWTGWWRKWVRLGLFLFYLVSLSPVLTLIGTWEGGLRGGRSAIRQGALATEILPRVGDTTSLFIAAVTVIDVEEWTGLTAEEQGSSRTDELHRQLQGFVNGEWELKPSQLEARLDELEESGGKLLAAEMMSYFRREYPEMAGGVAERLAGVVLEYAAGALLSRARAGKSRIPGLREFTQVLNRLPEVAQRSGKPESLSHRELVDHVLEAGIVPLVLSPIKSVVRSSQMGLLALGALFAILPVLFSVFMSRVRPGPSAGDENEGEQ